MTMMRAQSDPRRVYSRNGVTHVSYAGTLFAPGKEGTKLDVERDVKIEPLDAAGGKQRIAVSQKVGGRVVKETWRETKVPIHHRA